MTTSVKTCFKCHQPKVLGDFYSHPQMADGHLNKCKECTKSDATSHRKKNIEKIREYDRARGNRQASEYNKRYRLENYDRYKAHTAVYNAVRNGRLDKKPCLLCGEEKAHGHHVDYTKPLDVIWLCPSCHKQIHVYEDHKADILLNGRNHLNG